MTVKRIMTITAAAVLSLSMTGCLERVAAPAPVMHMGVRVSTAGMVLVRDGDTLWRIAKRYNLPVRDVIAVNGLVPPYTLFPGRRLSLPPPVDYRVGVQDTLHSVAHMFNVPVSQLVRVNGLRSPYRLRIGQMLRVPSRLGQNKRAEKEVATAKVTPALTPSKIRGSFNNVLGTLAKKTPVSSTPQPRKKVKKTPARKAVTASKMPRFIWPVKGKVISSYGPKKDGLYNDGINIAVPKGTPVTSAESGVVAYVGDALESYGNLILVRHRGGMVTAYAHLSAVHVKKGARVRKGQVLGAVGATGAVATSQLHFEIRRKTGTVNPRRHLG